MGQGPPNRRRKHRCASCCDWFPPQFRLGGRQKTCGKEICRKLWRARYRRKYRRKNRKEEQGYQDKRKSNRPPGYWTQYRKNHPDYVQRNRAASLLRKQLRTEGLQRQLDIVQTIERPALFDGFREFATSHRSLLLQCSLTSAVEGRPPP